MLSVCISCMAPLSPEDGHDRCPSCLGIEHLRQALTENACINCTCIPLAERTARLVKFASSFAEAGLPPSGTPAYSHPPGPKRRGHTQDDASVAKKRRRGVEPLALEVDTLASEFAQIKVLLLNLQPGCPSATAGTAASEPPLGKPPQSYDGTDSLASSPLLASQPDEDTLSIAASGNLFTDDDARGQKEPEGGSPLPSVTDSHGSGADSLRDAEASLSTVQQAVQLAVSRLGLDAAPVEAAPSNAFFKHAPQPSSFGVPPSEPYITELQRCWPDPKAFLYLPSDCNALAAMKDAVQYGLDQVPAIDASIASLIVSPDEALRPDARCPRPQCRVTDDLLNKSYDIAAQMGRIGNSLSHLVLAQSQTLQTAGADAQAQGLSDASLQVFAFLTRELGRLMSTLTLARRQVWLAQSPLSEACRKTLRTLPVIPGQMFGPAAQQALERSVQVNKVKQQFADLRQAPLPRPRHTSALQPMLRVTQEPAAPCSSRAVSIGPLGSLPFGRLRIGHPDTDHLPTDTPSRPKVVGVGPDYLDPGAGRFSPQHLGQWEALTSDPWVLLTLSKGYSIQFRRRPPKFNGVRMTVVKDPLRSLALKREISVLLEKGAIESVESLDQMRGFYSTYFLVPKKDGGFAGTPAFHKLEKVLTNKRVLKAVEKLSPHFQTSSLESFHSVIFAVCTQECGLPFHWNVVQTLPGCPALQ
ncbi:uncharacterized protein LOC125891834 [Epinephelus fuscoguttatus]|uniref:uncharacterized protein LOC125891834 n=1 Tax=Epinephelus fuscoguttatus TaxID=293821 RepID=UPI0020D12563|nr:uncharacterized protein LOC125891834 [Epinephelus fuscoguttatus]